MYVTVSRETPWSLALDLARETEGLEPIGKEPSSTWKRKLLKCRHSPLRTVMYRVRMVGIPYWVSVHLVRHGKFAEHFVRSQRPDRTGEDVVRDELPQGALVNHTIFTNAAELIEISKKRLCMLASKETRQVWEAVVEAMRNIDEAEMADAMQPECWHHGGRCPEMRPCGKCQPVESKGL